MIYLIPAGDSLTLQSALSSSQPGDEIVLPAGARYVGTFVLPPKAGEVRLRSSYGTWEKRATVDSGQFMATIASGSSGRAIDGTGAKNWRMNGVRFEPNVGGFGEVLGFENAENITLEAIVLVVPEGQQQKRGVLGNGRNITLTKSHLAGIWRSGQDSQAFAAWDGAGPYTITDNYLEAASENILFGGADAASAANIPADILIEGNTLTKNLAWKGQPRQVKNLLELKAAKRVIIRGNLLEHNWQDAQSGRAVLFTPRNQGGANPFAVIEDVLFEGNTIRDVPMVFNIAGYDDLNVSGQTTRIVIRDNDIQCEGMPFLLHNECGVVEIYRNKVTMPPDNVLVSFGRGDIATATGKRSAAFAVERLVFAETASAGSYIHSPDVTGPGAFVAHVKTQPVSLTVPTGGVSQPSTPELPSTPPVVDGVPEPLPGTKVDAPSVPVQEVDPVQAQLEKLGESVNILANAIGKLTIDSLNDRNAHAATKALLEKVVTLMDTAPNTSKAQALAAHFRGVK